MYTQPAPTTVNRVSPRTTFSTLFALIGLITLGIGVAVLYGGAWTAVVIGGIFILYSFILAIPERKNWG